MRQRHNATSAIRNVRVDLKVRPVVRVSSLPLLLVALKLPTVADKRRFRGKGKHFCFLRDPVVVHTLGVFGVTHKARNVQATVNFPLVADHADYGDRHASPILGLKHLVTVGLAPLYGLYVRRALAQDGHTHRFRTLGLGRTLQSRHVAGVQVERFALMLNVKVFSDTNGLVANPLRQPLVTDTPRHDRRDGFSVGEQPLVLFLGQVFRDKAPLGIRPAGVLDGGVHVHGERVANALNADVLVKGVLIAILSEYAYVTLAVGDLVVTGGVVSNVGVRDVLNVPHDAVKYLGYL